jgi:hypothetical protein
MTPAKCTIFAAALISGLLSACAQSTQDQNAPRSEAAPAAQAPAVASGDAGEQGGIARQDMMGMRGGGMPYGDGQGMITPMHRMMGMQPGIEHLEGRLAFLKAELKITDAQAPQWNAFSNAVRSNGKAMSQMHQTMTSRQNAPKTLPERLAFEQKAMSAHLDALNKTTAELDKLYAGLSPEQKKIADQIMIGPMGMPMGMM